MNSNGHGAQRCGNRMWSSSKVADGIGFRLIGCVYRDKSLHDCSARIAKQRPFNLLSHGAVAFDFAIDRLYAIDPGTGPHIKSGKRKGSVVLVRKRHSARARLGDQWKGSYLSEGDAHLPFRISSYLLRPLRTGMARDGIAL